MEIAKIISRNNEKIKVLKKLANKSFRSAQKQFIVENLKIIQDAWQAGFLPQSIFFTTQILESNPHLEKLLAEMKKKDKEFFLIIPAVNQAVSNLKTPSGIIAVYNQVESVIDLKQSILYLENVSDPGNMGTILRTALAFGWKDIVVNNCVDIYNPKTIQATKDAIFKLRIVFEQDLELFQKIQEKMKIYATVKEGGQEIETIKPDKQFCLVFGNEAKGISPVILTKADNFLTIKHSTEIESLNVAISVGIFCQYFKKV